MDTTSARANDAADHPTDDPARRTWVRHARGDNTDTHPDVIVGVNHYDDRVSAEHPEDHVRYLALLAARASRCASVEELDAAHGPAPVPTTPEADPTD